MFRSVWIFILVAGVAHGASLRESIGEAKAHLDAGRWRPARDGFVRVLVEHGRRLTGDARARLGLAAARASWRAGDRRDAGKLVHFASQQAATDETRARIVIAQRRLESARPVPAGETAETQVVEAGDVPAEPPPAAPVAEPVVLRDLPKSGKDPASGALPAASGALHVAADGGVRFLRAHEGALQTAHAIYRRPGGGPEVQLAGMVHIGVKSYYEAVTEDLKFTETILMEGLKGHDEQAEMSANPFARGNQWATGRGARRPREDAAGEPLVRQWAGLIRMPREAIEPCDMSFAELSVVEEKRFGTRNAVEYLVNGDFFDQLPGSFEPDIDLKEWAELLADKAPRPSLLAAVRHQVLNLVSSPPPEEVVDYLILTARNDHVMQALQRHLHRPRHHRVAICYGAAHMPDFHQRLTTMGYRLVEVRWNTVWRF